MLSDSLLQQLPSRIPTYLLLSCFFPFGGQLGQLLLTQSWMMLNHVFEVFNLAFQFRDGLICCSFQAADMPFSLRIPFGFHLEGKCPHTVRNVAFQEGLHTHNSL